MRATLGPELNDQEGAGKLLPLNFSFSSADEPAAQALMEAKDSVHNLFRWRGIVFWLGYLFAADFIAFTGWRLGRLLLLTPQIRRALKRRNIYLIINTATGADVAGPSLAFGACLATLLALGRLSPNGSGSRFLGNFMPSLLAVLPGCGVTGRLRRDVLEPVDGVREKLEALRSHPEINRAIIPKPNLDELEAEFKRGPINAYHPPVPVSGHESLRRALWSLIPVRKTWLVINLAVVSLALLAIQLLPSLAHDHLPPLSILQVRTSQASHTIQSIPKGGLPIRASDHVAIEVSPHSGDGSIVLEATRPRPISGGTENQCLRGTEKGDWRSMLQLPVNEQHVEFDFKRSPNARSGCSPITISLIHQGRAVVRWTVPLAVVGE